MNCAHKGRRAEHRARHLLIAAGYTVTRAAGSKGVADLIAWDAVHFRLVSVKAGSRYASAIERRTLRACPAPGNCTKEVWRFVDGNRTPAIEVL